MLEQLIDPAPWMPSNIGKLIASVLILAAALYIARQSATLGTFMSFISSYSIVREAATIGHSVVRKDR